MSITLGDMERIDVAAVAAATLKAVAYRMELTQGAVARAMALSNWTTIEEMIEREFVGAYRLYYPKCSMEARVDAVIAEVFDLLAVAFEDPRRALRCGAWTPPAAPAGGRFDG